MFIDEAEIEVVAGKGGDGSASFRREKFIPKGGPDGGDGGKGGDVYLVVRESLHGLAAANAQYRFKAEDGEPGRGKKQYGAGGKDIEVAVPPGTVVFLVAGENEFLVVDTATLTEDRYLIARGGKGGLGNVHFARADHQTPREFTPGAKGERKTLKLVVNHIADVGLVGLPNVGKSTLISRVSNAKPKVANYPFTTLEPHLGVVDHGGQRFVMADIPGLIEGAAEGKGLGHEFLKHLKRTGLLVHLLDAQSVDPRTDYETIRKELAAYDEELATRPELVAISRIDTLDPHRQSELKEQLADLNPIMLSSASGLGVDQLLDRVVHSLKTGWR